jgi:hypothetical protein
MIFQHFLIIIFILFTWIISLFINASEELLVALCFFLALFIMITNIKDSVNQALNDRSESIKTETLQSDIKNIKKIYDIIQKELVSNNFRLEINNICKKIQGDCLSFEFYYKKFNQSNLFFIFKNHLKAITNQIKKLNPFKFTLIEILKPKKIINSWFCHKELKIITNGYKSA